MVDDHSDHAPLLPDREWARIHRAHRVLRQSAEVLDRVAGEEEWPVPFGVVRFLVLAHLKRSGRLGLSPGRLAWILAVPRSTLSHHLGVLEGAGMIERSPRGLYDGRRVSVRLTFRGRYAVDRVESVLRRGARHRNRWSDWPLERRDAEAPGSDPAP